ncbi:MAG: hypothetical protein LBE59_02140 [Nevskiaceae bacterium]|nr:hypothetical protein [Nevskiaceae bacterium]
MLREALRFLWVKDEASGRHPPAKTLQWGLKNAGDAGQAYLSAYGYPNLRCVQQHLKAIRAEAVSAMRI